MFAGDLIRRDKVTAAGPLKTKRPHYWTLLDTSQQLHFAPFSLPPGLPSLLHFGPPPAGHFPTAIGFDTSVGRLFITQAEAFSFGRHSVVVKKLDINNERSLVGSNRLVPFSASVLQRLLSL